MNGYIVNGSVTFVSNVSGSKPSWFEYMGARRTSRREISREHFSYQYDRYHAIAVEMPNVAGYSYGTRPGRAREWLGVFLLVTPNLCQSDAEHSVKTERHDTDSSPAIMRIGDPMRSRRKYIFPTHTSWTPNCGALSQLVELGDLCPLPLRPNVGLPHVEHHQTNLVLEPWYYSTPGSLVSSKCHQKCVELRTACIHGIM